MTLKSWVEISVGDIAQVIAGGTPKAGDPENFKLGGTGISWLTPADLSGYKNKFIKHGKRDLSQIGYEKSSAKLMPAGSLLFSSRAPIGYVVIAEDEISTNQGFKNFVFSTGVDSSYAYYYLKNIRGLAESLGTGTTFKEISGATAKKLPFLLPPLAEQKVIADKLDSLLAQVETTKARLDGIPDILKRFRQSVLAAAVSGRLTEEWRKNESSVGVLHENILQSRRRFWEQFESNRLLAQGKSIKSDKWKSRYKDPASIVKDDCFDIPKNWCWSNVGEIAWSVKDGPHYSPKYTESGIPFISGGNITPQGINFSKCKYISPELNKELSVRCKPEIGDMLYTKGGTTGIAYYNEEPKDFNVWVHVAVLKITDVVNGKFLQHALNSKHCYQLSQKYTRGVGNQDLGLTRMINITVPLPPRDEQAEIVRRVEELFAFADAVEQKAQAASERVNKLTQSILAKAFRGELTADWRAANPDLISGENSAEALLEKIKAEREAMKPKKKARAKRVKKA